MVRGLVKRGQLKFVDGGWSQHDEGCAHFSTMLDQTAFGSAFLSAELGVRPTIGWHLDVFGHTATQAALLSAEVGFDALWSPVFPGVHEPSLWPSASPPS